MGARRGWRPFVVVVAAGLLGLAGTLVGTAPAVAAVPGTFVPVAQTGSCTPATGYSSSDALCGAGIAGNKYLYLATSGASLTYAFTVPSGSTETLTYGIPAGGFVNNVAGTVSVDGGAPVTVDSDLGPFDQTTPTDLSLWTSPALAAGPHTWTVTSTGDAVNIYGLWISTVGVTVPCGTGTTSCSATLDTPSQTVAVTGTKPSPTSGTITVEVVTSVLSCQDFGYSAPVVTLTDGGLQSGSAVTVTDTVSGLPSTKGVKVCYEPVGSSPPPPVFLKKCHGKKFKGACIESLSVTGTGSSATMVVTLLVPAGDPRYHVGGELPEVTSFSPATPKPGKKLTIKGFNLSEVTGVSIGGTAAHILKAAPTKVSVTAPAGAHGIITVTSQAGVATSAADVTVA
ncbi:MAG TPA: IPT/TIG domain-containing protein [Acidimicrobiales bacterium]|nr:IPT/TIG domain-containing protein [Acidimicrobiales bacterium]